MDPAASPPKEVQETPEEASPPEENVDQESPGKITECDLCQKQFPSRQSYEVHAKVVHQGEKPYTCNVCNKTFAYHTSLKGHMITHEVIIRSLFIWN